MRTREYDRSIVLDDSTKNVVVGGFSVRLSDNIVAARTGSIAAKRLLKNREYGFFIDEPHRPRSKRFGEADRWEEHAWPVTEPWSLFDTRFNADGYDNTHVSYTDGGRWRITTPNCRLFSNSLQSELLNGPWPYRVRSRVSLNNAVQQQRQRMYAYNGDLSETFGELPECPQLFRLINTAKSLRSNVTGLALGIRFGWKPLYDVFQSAMAELDAWRQGVSALRKRVGIQTLRYSGDDSWDLTNSMGRIVTWDGDSCSYAESLNPQLVFHKGKITYSAVVEMRPYYSGATWDVMSHLARIGGIPSLRTFWELFPKSFVIDWFVALGDVISDIQGNLLYHIDVKEQCWSWLIHDRVAQIMVNPLQTQKLTEMEYKAFYRSSTPPLGSWKVPRVGLPSSLGQLTSLALMVSQKIPSSGVPLKVLLRRLNRYGYR